MRRYGSRSRAVEERVDPLDTLGDILTDAALEMSPLVNIYRGLLYEDEYPITPFATPRDRALTLLEEPEYQRYMDNVAFSGMGATTKVGRAAKALPAPRTKAEAVAKDVLELRAAGKAEKVTDEMMAAADPQYLFENTPLPMDEPHRMARGQELGFDTDRPMFHGTNADFTEFDNAKIGTGPGRTPPMFPQGTYFGRWPDELDDYAVGEGANIIPVYLRRGKVEDRTDSGAMRRFNEGDADTFRSSPSGVEVVKDPRNIRSRFARFDPEFRHLANLSAGVGGLGILSLLEPEPEVP